MQNSCMKRSSFAPRVHNVLGEKCRWIRLFTSVVQKRLGFQETAWKILAERVERGPFELRDDAGEILAIQTSVSLIIEPALVSSDSSWTNSAKNCEATICDSISEEGAHCRGW